MSKDFPNREDWLAIRNTPRKRPTKIFHQSTQYKEEINEKTKEKHYVKTQFSTYRKSSNESEDAHREVE